MNEEFFKQDLLNPPLDSFLRLEGVRERYIYAVANTVGFNYGRFINRINHINRLNHIAQIKNAFPWNEEPGFEQSYSFWENLAYKFDEFAAINFPIEGIELNPVLDAFLIENGLRERFLHAVARDSENEGTNFKLALEKINNSELAAITNAFRWRKEFGWYDTRSAEFWDKTQEKYIEFYKSKNVEIINKYRIQLKPSLDSFLREHGLRKKFISKVKEYAKSENRSMPILERVINSTIGGYCILCSINAGGEYLLWEKACNDFGKIEYQIEIN